MRNVCIHILTITSVVFLYRHIVAAKQDGSYSSRYKSNILRQILRAGFCRD